jgi:hypothetical protein
VIAKLVFDLAGLSEMAINVRRIESLGKRE